MLTEQFEVAMKAAMKGGDKVALSAIRMLRAAVKDKEIELGHKLADDEALALLGKLIKQRKESATQYEAAARPDLAEKELAEATIFAQWLPEPLSEGEVNALIDAAIAEIGAQGMRDMGKVMNIVRPKVQGRADMGLLSAQVKGRLQS